MPKDEEKLPVNLTIHELIALFSCSTECDSHFSQIVLALTLAQEQLNELLPQHDFKHEHAELAPGETLLRLALLFPETCRVICHTWSLCRQLNGRQWGKLYAYYGNEFFTAIHTNAAANTIDWIRETQAAYHQLSAHAENDDAIILDPLLFGILLLMSGIEKEKLLALGKKCPQAAAIIIRQKILLRTLSPEDVFSLGLMHAAASDGLQKAILCLINKLVERYISDKEHFCSFNSKHDLDGQAIIQGFSTITCAQDKQALPYLLLSLIGLDILKCHEPSKAKVESFLNSILNEHATFLSAVPVDLKGLIELMTAFRALPIHYLSIRLRCFRALYTGFMYCDDLRWSVRQKRHHQFITEQLPPICERSIATLRELTEIAKQASQVFLLIKKLRKQSGVLAEKAQKCLLAREQEESELYLQQSEILDSIVGELKQAYTKYYERDFSVPGTLRNDRGIKQQLLDILRKYLSDKKSPLHMHFNPITRDVSERNHPYRISSNIPAEQSTNLIRTFELEGWMPNNSIRLILVEVLSLLDQAIIFETEVVNNANEGCKKVGNLQAPKAH